MVESQSNVLRLVILNFINSYIVKKGVRYFVRSQKQQQRRVLNILTYIIFTIGLLTFNYYFHKLSTHPNLYDQIGVSRKMSNAEIKNHVQQLKVQTMIQNEQNLAEAMKKIHKLQETQKILTHNARRLTYDTFELTDTQYAWAFMSPNFLVSVLIGSSVFYIICLVMNIMGKDNKYINLKGEIIIIIMAFIWQTQTIMHSESRFHHTPDVLDSIFTAFPIYQRREVLKYLISPISMLLQNFNTLFLYNSSQTRLKELTEWVPPEYFIPIQNKLKQSNIKVDDHLQQSVSVALKQMSEKVAEKSKKHKSSGQQAKEMEQKIQMFIAQRNLLKKFVQLQSSNIYKDLGYAKIVHNYMLSVA